MNIKLFNNIAADKPDYLWDRHGTRLQLLHTHSGANYNWLCFPGGPGGDSSYLRALGDNLKVPGNIWLIDLPANGSNQHEYQGPDYPFAQWFDLILPLVEQFTHPIMVGHAFGATLALQTPPLAKLLKGLVIISSSPTPNYIEKTLELLTDKETKHLDDVINEFHANPCRDTYYQALLAFTPFYFSPEHLQAGQDFLRQNPANYAAPIWWHHHIKNWQDSVRWVPSIPTLIMAGSHDRMTTLDLFADDKRFAQDHILLTEIANASHFPWLENMPEIQKQFDNLLTMIES